MKNIKDKETTLKNERTNKVIQEEMEHLVLILLAKFHKLLR